MLASVKGLHHLMIGLSADSPPWVMATKSVIAGQWAGVGKKRGALKQFLQTDL